MALVSSNTIGRDGVMEGFLRVTRRLTDLSLDNQMLKHLSEGNW
jgi:hypothetical protein